MDIMNQVLTIIISIIGSFIISALTLIHSFKTHRQEVILNSITQNRINWINDVRTILQEFIIAYLSSRPEIELRKIKSKCELFFNNKDSYNNLIQQMEKCCQNPYNPNNQDDYLDYMKHSQYVLARVWERIKVEGGQSLNENKRIKHEVDLRTDFFKP